MNPIKFLSLAMIYEDFLNDDEFLSDVEILKSSYLARLNEDIGEEIIETIEQEKIASDEEQESFRNFTPRDTKSYNSGESTSSTIQTHLGRTEMKRLKKISEKRSSIRRTKSRSDKYYVPHE